jgi:hypothetical protein
MKKQTLREKRLRAFVLDRKTGRPLPGVPILATVETKDGQQIPLGVLASDHAGFVSFDLKHLAAIADNVAQVSVHSLGDEAKPIDISTIDQLAYGSGVIPILTDPLPVDPHIPRQQLPSTQGLDPGKWFISPNSFFTNPSTRLGEGGCELLLPSNSATHEFRFRQVIRTVGDSLLIKQPESDNPNTPDSTVDEFWEAKSFRLGKGYVFEYKMIWYPLGHSLGRLLYSLPLAPCESVNLAVIDWSRRDEAMRFEETTLSERLVHSQRRDRMIEETVKASLDEWQGGGSFMAGHAGAGSFDLGGVLSLGATDAMGGSYSSSGGERDLAATNVQKLSDNIVQKSSAIRNLRSTVITQVSQQEHEVIETRTVTNHNHCHALTILYYEVLRHYRIITECVSKQRVLFVDYDVKGFDRKTAFCKRLILEQVLLDQRLRGCFDSVERLLYCTPKEMLREAETTSGSSDHQIEKLLVTVSTRDENWAGTDSKVYLLLKVEEETEPRTFRLKGEFERGDTETFTILLDSPVVVEEIRQVGLRYRERGLAPDWKLEGLRVEYQLADEHQLRELYNNDSIDREFTESQDWWAETTNPPPETVVDASLVEMQKRIAEDTCCADRLVSHLNCHKVYYWNAIWMLEDPNERIYRFKTTDTEAEPFKSVRLWNHIENRPVGALGDVIAFPELGSKPEPATDEEGNPIEPVINCVALPVHGVFAEAQLGRCNACEEKDITRFWDWSESPCPEKAPEIAPIIAGSRAQETNLQPSAMPNPIVNIVNPPAAPDPTGLAAALNLLATPNIFRDMSGLQEVSDLLQKLSEGAISLAQARQKAKQIQERQNDGTQGGLGDGTTGQPTPQEQHDQLQVYRNAEAKGDLTSEEQKQMAKDYLENAQYKQPVSGSNQTASTSTVNCRTFTPTDVTKIVLNSMEYDAPGQISYFRNWGDALNVHHFTDPVTATCQDPSTINLIVLHETARDQTDAAHPTYMTTTGSSVHFIVSKQGSITQHNDIVERLHHAGHKYDLHYNDSSIGIEFANRAWVDDTWIDPEDPNRTISLPWAVHGKRYALPSLDALESLVYLVQWLLEHSNLAISAKWAQETVIPDTSTPGFLMSLIGKKLPLAHRANLSGIVAHQMIADHGDGSFQALYTWLRLKGLDGQGITDPSQAYATALGLVQESNIVRMYGQYLVNLSSLTP